MDFTIVGEDKFHLKVVGENTNNGSPQKSAIIRAIFLIRDHICEIHLIFKSAIRNHFNLIICDTSVNGKPVRRGLAFNFRSLNEN